MKLKIVVIYVLLFSGCSPEMTQAPSRIASSSNEMKQVPPQIVSSSNEMPKAPPQIDSPSKSWIEKVKLGNQEKRKKALAALENADSLEDFLDVERSNWMLGPESIDNKFISEKRREWYVKNHSDLSPEIREVIIAGKWVIGMKRNDLLASFGVPYKINRTVTSNVINEQWIYDYDIRVPRKTTYFYFVNDVLTSWQD
jgi:hypothetical protein